MLQCDEMAQGDNAHTQNFHQFKETTNKLLQHLLFQMSPLPVCVLSLLPCGAPERCRAQQQLRKRRTCREAAAFPCHSALEGTASQAEPGGPGPGYGRAGGSCTERRPRPRQEPLLSPPPRTFIPEDESQKRHRLNYDRLRMRLYHPGCYFCCVRKVILPEVATKHCYLSKAPSLVQ